MVQESVRGRVWQDRDQKGEEGEEEEREGLENIEETTIRILKQQLWKHVLTLTDAVNCKDTTRMFSNSNKAFTSSILARLFHHSIHNLLVQCWCVLKI